MRDFRDAKTMAHSLREALAAKDLKVTHSESLELVSKLLGAPDWNTLSAAIQAEMFARLAATSPKERVVTPGDQPIDGRLAALHLGVGDARRATAFFGDLFGWTFAAGPNASSVWSRTNAGIAERPWRLAISDRPSEPCVRLGFEVSDPLAAFDRARSLGGAGRSPEEASDDQGLPIAFSAPAADAPSRDLVSGEPGVAVAMVDDTAKARNFYERLFGGSFGQIGRGDRWWSHHDAFGLFSKALGDPGGAPAVEGVARDVHMFVCVRELDAHKARLRSLGGEVLSESAMGPYQVCDCRDDQGTRFHLWRDPAR
jgi:predicted enzyme related to lactoylglutathione lyase